MKFLALERKLKTDGFTELLMKEEAACAWALQKAGIIREIYFQKDPRVAVIILECESAAEAEAHLGTLPLVREDLIAFTITELVPYDGYERLFTK